jgi:hypothetical protein
MKKLRGLKALVQDAVDKGATAIEQVHKRTAAKPFELLAKVPSIAAPVRGVHQVYELAVSGSYGMVRLVNRMVGNAVDVAFDALEQSRAQSASRPPDDVPQGTVFTAPSGSELPSGQSR